MNIKMKTLSLAVLGLASFAVAGSASAACVAGNLSAWSSTSALGGALTVATGGLEGSPSECRLDASVTAGPGASAFVRDNTPANEARYRAQYLLNIDALGAITSIQTVNVFTATTETPANGISQLVRMTVGANVTGAIKLLNVITVNGTSVTSGTVALAAGANRVEIDYVKGATGSLKVWVNNTVEGSPNLNLPVNNNAWGGVDFVALGLAAASPAYRAGTGNHANQIVQFDRFDSRRQTFIGG